MTYGGCACPRACQQEVSTSSFDFCSEELGGTCLSQKSQHFPFLLLKPALPGPTWGAGCKIHLTSTAFMFCCHLLSVYLHSPLTLEGSSGPKLTYFFVCVSHARCDPQ